jgi:hypothetical protein
MTSPVSGTLKMAPNGKLTIAFVRPPLNRSISSVVVWSSDRTEGGTRLRRRPAPSASFYLVVICAR